MKWINNFEPLKIKQVNDKDVEIKKYCEDVWIIKEENREYLMIKRNFKNNFKRNMDEVIIKDNAEIEVKTNCNDKKQSLYLDYGAEGSIIIDMNGIDNFRFAESEVFNDYTIRKIVKKMNLLAEGEYLRIGASGARENGNHPGGEVFEYSLIQNNKCEGLSQNVSGYLPKNECYSRSIPLFEDDEKTLKEGGQLIVRGVDKLDCWSLKRMFKRGQAYHDVKPISLIDYEAIMDAGFKEVELIPLHVIEYYKTKKDLYALLVKTPILDDFSEKSFNEYERRTIEKEMFEKYVKQNTTEKGIKLIRRYYGIIGKK